MELEPRHLVSLYAAIDISELTIKFTLSFTFDLNFLLTDTTNMDMKESNQRGHFIILIFFFFYFIETSHFLQVTYIISLIKTNMNAS